MTVSFPTSPESRRTTKLWMCCHCGRRNVYSPPDNVCGKRLANFIVFGDGFDCRHKQCSECEWKRSRHAPPPEKKTTSVPPTKTTAIKQSQSASLASDNGRHTGDTGPDGDPVNDLSLLPSPVSPLSLQDAPHGASQMENYGQVNGGSLPDPSEPSPLAIESMAPLPLALSPPASHIDTPNTMSATGKKIPPKLDPFYGMFPLPPPRTPPVSDSGVSDMASETAETQKHTRSKLSGQPKLRPASESLRVPPSGPPRPSTAPPADPGTPFYKRPGMRAARREMRHRAAPPLKNALKNPFSFLRDSQTEDGADEDPETW